MRLRAAYPLLSLLLPGTVTACGDPVGPTGSLLEPPDVTAWVVGEAAAALDSRGHFILPEPVSLGNEPIITRDMAGRLAEGVVVTWIANPDVVILPGTHSIRAKVEEEHGSGIDWNGLRFDRRVAYFAESPYEPLPDTVPIWTRRFYGPHYLVPLYALRSQAVSIAVAAYSTDLKIDDTGFVLMPRHSGNEFVTAGVPGDLEVGVPLWPEEAVRRIAEATAVKVTEVPRLFQPGERWAPQGARWKLSLNREIEVQNLETGERVHTNTVFVGVWRSHVQTGQPEIDVRWYIPEPTQPHAEEIRYHWPREHRDDPIDVRTASIRFRKEVPVLFDEVMLLSSPDTASLGEVPDDRA